MWDVINLLSLSLSEDKNNWLTWMNNSMEWTHHKHDWKWMRKATTCPIDSWENESVAGKQLHWWPKPTRKPKRIFFPRKTWARPGSSFVSEPTVNPVNYKYYKSDSKLDLEIRPKLNPNWLLCITLFLSSNSVHLYPKQTADCLPCRLLYRGFHFLRLLDEDDDEKHMLPTSK